MENIAPRFIKGEEKMRKKMLCYGMALCFMILPGSQRVSAAENLENACIWLKDEGYSFTPDLDADELEEQTITSEYVTNVWPSIGSDGTISDELWNYAYQADEGDAYLKRTENGKYLYFFTDISSDLSRGTLKYIQMDQLSDNENDLATIDTDVSIGNTVDVEPDGSVLYQKSDENGTKLYYFDGQESFCVAEDVVYAKLDGKTVYYEKYDEAERRCDLYGKNVYNDASEKMIASDVYWTDVEGMPGTGYYYLYDGEVFYVAEGSTLFKSSFRSGTEVLAENVGQLIRCDGRKIWYIKWTRNISLLDYVDFSHSQYTDSEINSFIQEVKEDEDMFLEVSQIYSYDFESGREEKALDDFLMGEDGNALISKTSQNNCIFTGDFSSVLPENVGKTSADMIFSASGLSDVEAAKEALYEWFSEQLESKVGTDGIPVRSILLGEKAKACTVDQLSLFSDDLSAVELFNKGEKVAAIKNDRLYIGETSAGETWMDTGVESADDLAIIGDQLFYTINEDLYFYHDGNSVYLGPNCDFWSSYEDGTILLLSYFDGPVYGGNLWYIDINGNSQEIDENVTRFAALESGEILYIKEGKAVLYSGGIKTQVADEVRVMLPFGEKEKTRSVYSAW